MLSEGFIDQALKALCNNKEFENLNINTAIQQIKLITNIHFDVHGEPDVASSFNQKLAALTFVIAYREKTNGSYDKDKLKESMAVGKYSDLLPVIAECLENPPTHEEFFKDFQRNLTHRYRLSYALSNRNILETIKNLDAGDYDDAEELVMNWEGAIQELYNNIKDFRKLESLEDMTELDLANGDYTSILRRLTVTDEEGSTIPTGYRMLENALPAGGFERGRLYIIGGTSGVGKSALMINLMNNGVELFKAKETDKEKPDLHLYITAENLIHETLERYYCSLTNTSTETFKNKLSNDKTFNIEKDIKSKLLKLNTNVMIKYISKRSSVQKIEDIIREHVGDYNIRSVYVDYLDLLTYSKTQDLRRLDLEDVTMALKNIAVEYDLPVITATQLNRAGYDRIGSADLTQMSESMGKVNNADLIVFLQRGQNEHSDEFINGANTTCRLIRGTVVKNRNGPTGESCYFLSPEKLVSRPDISVFSYKFIESRITLSGSNDPSTSSNIQAQNNDKSIVDESIEMGLL